MQLNPFVMRKNVHFILLMGVIVGILLSGCNKLEDRLDKDPLATSDLCQVKAMTYSVFSTPIGVTINYKWGDPVSVIQTSSGTGHPDGYFRYDNKRRLTDYIGIYGNSNGFEFWHRYVYDKKDRVIRDTSYFLGIMVNDKPAFYNDGAVIYYEYDQYGRIVHTSQDWFSFPGSPTDSYYSYDAKGNLVIPGVTYDNKVSIHRTNRIWMFIDRNYSVNNAYATTWNEYGLPTKMGLSDQGGRFAGFYYGSLDTVEYKCKGAQAQAFSE
jgi:hypothetical protein